MQESDIQSSTLKNKSPISQLEVDQIFRDLYTLVVRFWSLPFPKKTISSCHLHKVATAKKITDHPFAEEVISKKHA